MRYFFEIWLRGFAKDQLRHFSTDSDGSYHPHITLIRPFNIITSEDEVQDKVVSYCSGKEPIYYTLEGRTTFAGDIQYVPVLDAEDLLDFNNGLEKVLESDVMFAVKLDENKVLHATLETQRVIPACPRIEQYMLRLTGLRDKHIWFSYDFVTGKVLDREQSLHPSLWYKTVHLFSDRTGLLPTRNGFQMMER